MMNDGWIDLNEKHGEKFHIDNFQSLISDIGKIISYQQKVKSVNLGRQWYIMNTIYKNYYVNIYVKLIDNKVVLKMVRNPEIDTSCLTIIINNELKAILDLIKIPERGGNCEPIPSGSWLIEYSTALLCFFGIKYVRLVDVSTFRCKNSDKQYSAKMYRLYNKQKTFYEKFGYKHIDGTQSVKYIDELMNQKFINVIRFAEKDNDEYGEHINDKSIYMLNKLNEFNVYPDKYVTILEYMSKLYKIDCDLYSIVDDFIYYASDAIISLDGDEAKIDNTWAWLYVEVNNSLYQLENYLEC